MKKAINIRIKEEVVVTKKGELLEDTEYNPLNAISLITKTEVKMKGGGGGRRTQRGSVTRGGEYSVADSVLTECTTEHATEGLTEAPSDPGIEHSSDSTELTQIKTIITRWGNVGTQRQTLVSTGIPDSYFKDNTHAQYRIISQLYSDVSFIGRDEIKRLLCHKLASYERQDKEKERYPTSSSEHFVDYAELLELLVLSRGKCYYCNGGLKILYKEVRDMKQWTLDRIDNSEIHHAKNCRVACLECNLQKRKRDDAGFLFTKRLKVGKANEFIKES